MDVIAAILDIDNTAKKMMEDAHRQSEELLMQARETENNIKDDISAEVERALDKFEAQQKEEAEGEKQKIRSDTDAAMKKLDDEFAKSHEQWEMQIYSSIIAGK